MGLPTEYIASAFNTHAGYVKFNRFNNTYQGCCPICREGKSWGRKRRCFYVPDKNLIYCHNCGWSSRPITWIREVSGLSDEDIIAESMEYDYFGDDISNDEDTEGEQRSVPPLPHDSINIFDDRQVLFYGGVPEVRRCIEYVHSRRLHTAINKPCKLFISLTDFTHRNRLVLPFYDECGDITYYQSRLIPPDDGVTYLSKSGGGDRSLFNVGNIDMSGDTLFVFEGPIDCCFVKNGIAVGGIQESSDRLYTNFQHTQIEKYGHMRKVVVLDSQWFDTTSLHKTKILIDQGYEVFIWPEKFGTRFKDFNKMACDIGVDAISPKFILDNTASGLSASLKLAEINRRIA